MGWGGLMGDKCKKTCQCQTWCKRDISYTESNTDHFCEDNRENALAALTIMGGAADTAGTAAVVPLLREVRQDKFLPYHILVKKISNTSVI